MCISIIFALETDPKNKLMLHWRDTVNATDQIHGGKFDWP